MRYFCGIDLGGTKTEVILLGDEGQQVLRERVPTLRDSYDATLETIAGQVKRCEDHVGETVSVGVGHPGAHDPQTGLIKNANSTWLIGRAFDADLSAYLGRPVAMANDANCLGLSEATDGAAAGKSVVFAVICGTGIGGALVIDGKIVTGRQAISGEWGHMPLPWPEAHELPGPDCYCGLRGCVETWCSGIGFENDYFRTTGEKIRAPEILGRVADGEASAIACLDALADRFARSLAVVINIVDPDVIVLGGGLSNVDALYEKIAARWGQYIFAANALQRADNVPTTELVKARYGDSSGVRGAAWLGRQLAQETGLWR